MADIKKQIFQELSALEDAALHLRSAASAAGRQTDLEVAILTQQVKKLREKNEKATELVDMSVSILKNLK